MAGVTGAAIGAVYGFGTEAIGSLAHDYDSGHLSFDSIGRAGGHGVAGAKSGAVFGFALGVTSSIPVVGNLAVGGFLGYGAITSAQRSADAFEHGNNATGIFELTNALLGAKYAGKHFGQGVADVQGAPGTVRGWSENIRQQRLDKIGNGLDDLQAQTQGLIRQIDDFQARSTTPTTEVRNCFVAGTEIQTKDGEQRIEDIHVGDWVLSDDPNTPGDIEYKQVLQTFAHDTSELVDVYVGGEKITTTEEHPFWVPDVGWVAAKDLHAGSHLQTKYESWLDVDKVVKHSGLATVYNFEVAGFHTYFVSDLGLLVHNECKVNNTLFRGDDSYKQGDPLGWKIGSPEWENAKIQTPWEHVNNNLPEPSSQKSRFTSFAQKVDDAITFTDKGKVLKVRLKDLQEVEGIEIYTPERVKQMMKDASMKSKEINAIYDQMTGNSEILIEGEIPASLISLAKLKSK